jgi:large subunit ribosomal protein L22
MEYSATSKYIHTSTRKLRLIADAIRRISPSEALVQLAHMPKVGAKEIENVIASAVANAKQKQVKVETLKFKRIEVMGGPVMKRWHAASKGQAHPYKKRMTHICIVLTDNNEMESGVVKEENQKNAK